MAEANDITKSIRRIVADLRNPGPKDIVAVCEDRLVIAEKLEAAIGDDVNTSLLSEYRESLARIDAHWKNVPPPIHSPIHIEAMHGTNPLGVLAKVRAAAGLTEEGDTSGPDAVLMQAWKVAMDTTRRLSNLDLPDDQHDSYVDQQMENVIWPALAVAEHVEALTVAGLSVKLQMLLKDAWEGQNCTDDLARTAIAVCDRLAPGSVFYRPIDADEVAA